MGDLKNKNLIYLKGGLFLLAGIISALLIVIQHPNLKLIVLLGLSIWCFCRFYYFAFYVIQHYVDDQYKFSGLWSLVKHVMGTPHKNQREP